MKNLKSEKRNSIEKKIWFNISPSEVSTIFNKYLVCLDSSILKTINFTIIRDGKNFNLILITSGLLLTKRQIINAVNDILNKI